MNIKASPDPRRALPSVDRLLTHPVVDRLYGLYGREAVRATVRAVLREARRRLAAHPDGEGGGEQLVDRLAAQVGHELDVHLGARMHPVLNATGIFLHTNLGRAPLPDETADALALLATEYCDLEIELDSGERSDRNRRAAELLRALTGAEAALVVNNNAGALLLALSALAAGKDVLISRGELVEIGGSFRVPEILTSAGARLVEVGTTNRTRLVDYQRAVSDETAILLKVEPSNFRQTGFVASVGAAALADLAHRHGKVAVVDQGSGLLRPHPAPQLRDYPSTSELIAAGVDLVCGSGDKLLGGPQAGLLVGRREIIERCHRHPLYRALRPGRLTLVALESILRRHLRGEPTLMDRLWPDPLSHRQRVTRVGAEIGAGISDGDAYIGGGSAPERAISGEVLVLPGDEALAKALRRGEPAVVGYMKDGQLILDLRTVSESRDRELVEVVLAAKHGLERHG